MAAYLILYCDEQLSRRLDVGVPAMDRLKSLCKQSPKGKGLFGILSQGLPIRDTHLSCREPWYHNMNTRYRRNDRAARTYYMNQFSWKPWSWEQIVVVWRIRFCISKEPETYVIEVQKYNEHKAYTSCRSYTFRLWYVTTMPLFSSRLVETIWSW